MILIQEIIGEAFKAVASWLSPAEIACSHRPQVFQEKNCTSFRRQVLGNFTARLDMSACRSGPTRSTMVHRQC